MSRYVFTIILAVLLISPAAGAASEMEKTADTVLIMGSFAPKPGAWSEYALFDKTTGKRSVMRMSIVGIENDSYWYEMMMKEGGNLNIVKMMVTGNPNNSENIKRIIVKAGAKPARELNNEAVREVRKLASRLFEEQSGILTSPDVKLHDIEAGEGEVTVPAGTFEVEIHRVVDEAGTVYAEYKNSEEVRPFGLVTLETENTTMVLAGQGDDAKSLISEEPVMLDETTAEPEEIFKQIAPSSKEKQERPPESGNTIRQIPGMGTGYEPKD